MNQTPQIENTEATDQAQAVETLITDLSRAQELAAAAATHPAGGEPLRELAPLLVQLLVTLAADVEQLKAEAVRHPCEGCGGCAGQDEKHDTAQG